MSNYFTLCRCRAGASIAEALAAKLHSGHAALCPWRNNPSPVEFIRPDITSAAGTRREFLERWASLQQLEAVSLPPLAAISPAATAILAKIRRAAGAPVVCAQPLPPPLLPPSLSITSAGILSSCLTSGHASLFPCHCIPRRPRQRRRLTRRVCWQFAALVQRCQSILSRLCFVCLPPPPFRFPCNNWRHAAGPDFLG